jgi:hypothetical protein
MSRISAEWRNNEAERRMGGTVSLVDGEEGEKHDHNIVVRMGTRKIEGRQFNGTARAVLIDRLETAAKNRFAAQQEEATPASESPLFCRAVRQNADVGTE